MKTHSWTLSLAASLLLVTTPVVAEAQARLILGRVSDSVTADPVQLGQVHLLGTEIGAPLNPDGTFVIYVPYREVTLSIRALGYQAREVVVPRKKETVILTLERDYFQLDEIVVSGQATGVRRRHSANAIGVVRGDELSRVPAQTVESALKGKVAGVHIASNSGAPGGGLRWTLRGVSSILGNNDPLFVVDGVVISNAKIPGGVNAITQGQRGVIASMQENPGNRLGDLNPNDIASIEILKGASASAMYGSKASNGVVIITTKRGGY